MRPAAVALVANEIVVSSRRNVVECGAGVSTLVMAQLLKDRGGHLWSVEDDPEWAALVRRWLSERGLETVVTLTVAELEDGWYRREVLDAEAPLESVDLLVVDGPQAWNPRKREARYPAAPYFRDRLADDWSIVLDDISRLGEFSVAERWEAELGVPVAKRVIENVGIARSRGAFLI
jgi:predicted O-methyltransferase YrrM